jgi:hypothetical protein
MPENVPFKRRVLDALTEVVASITPANGYTSDLGTFIHTDGAEMRRVYRGRAFFGDNDPLPMVAILERPDPADELAEPPRDSTTGTYDWNLIVQGFVQDDKDDPTDPAYIILADIRHRLAVERNRRDDSGRIPNPLGFGGRRKHNRIEELSFGPGVVRPADEVSAKAYFWLGVTLKTFEDPLFPFL